MGEADNAERVLEGMRAYATGDFEPVLGYIHPEAEWRPPIAGLTGVPYVGPEGVRRWYADLQEGFEWVLTDELEVRTLPDRVLVRGRFRGRARESGLEVEQPVIHGFEFADGMVVAYESTLQPSDERLRELGWHEARPYGAGVP